MWISDEGGDSGWVGRGRRGFGVGEKFEFVGERDDGERGGAVGADAR